MLVWRWPSRWHMVWSGAGTWRWHAAASGGAARPALQELVDEIIQLGHMPKQPKNASVEEKRLAVRLLRARKAGSLTREQESALANLAQVEESALLMVSRPFALLKRP